MNLAQQLFESTAADPTAIAVDFDRRAFVAPFAPRDEGDFRRARYLDAGPLAPGDRFGSVTPLRFGAARQRYGDALSAGAGAVILDERLDLPSIVEQIHRAGVTHLYCVPMHPELLCDHAQRTPGGAATT